MKCTISGFSDDGSPADVASAPSIVNSIPIPGDGIGVAAMGGQLFSVSPPDGVELFAGWIAVDCGTEMLQVDAELEVVDSVDDIVGQAESTSIRSVTPIKGSRSRFDDLWLQQDFTIGGNEDQPLRRSAFAVVNPTDEPTTVTVRLSLPGEPEAGAVRSLELTLGPRERLARFGRELFDDLSPTVIPEPPPIVSDHVVLSFESSAPFVVGGIDVLFPSLKFAPATQLR